MVRAGGAVGFGTVIPDPSRPGGESSRSVALALRLSLCDSSSPAGTIHIRTGPRSLPDPLRTRT